MVRKFGLLLALIAITGCGSAVVPAHEAHYDTALHKAIADAVVVCKDGVQYLFIEGYGSAFSVTARLHHDGKPYTCMIVPTTTYKQVPDDPIARRLAEVDAELAK